MPELLPKSNSICTLQQRACPSSVRLAIVDLHVNLRPSIYKSLWAQFKWQLVYMFFLQLLSAAFSFGNPIIIPYMVSFVDSKSIAYWEGYVLAAVVFLTTVLSSIFYYKSQWVAGMIGLRVRLPLTPRRSLDLTMAPQVRAVLMAAIYRKVLSSPATVKSIQGTSLSPSFNFPR